MAIVIDITGYDPEDQSRIQYFLDKKSFDHPPATIKRLAWNPAVFLTPKGNEYCSLVLTGGQNGRFLDYLRKSDYFAKDFGGLRKVSHLLAFSYGENPDVNSKLAEIAQQTIQKAPHISVAAQWEIADALGGDIPGLTGSILRIGLDEGQDYITTEQVIQKWLNLSGGTENSSFLIVAQAWHAPRCIQLCKNRGLHIAAGRFANHFSPHDPQPWVQNAFRWVLKEGTKKLSPPLSP
jgi:hypothetical protein